MQQVTRRNTVARSRSGLIQVPDDGEAHDATIQESPTPLKKGLGVAVVISQLKDPTRVSLKNLHIA